MISREALSRWHHDGAARTVRRIDRVREKHRRMNSFLGVLYPRRVGVLCGFAPVVNQTHRQFLRLMAAIIDVVGDDFFTHLTLRNDANELTYHDAGGARELRAAIGTMSSVGLGKALATLARDGDFGGYRLVRITSERNLVLWQAQKALKGP